MKKRLRVLTLYPDEMNIYADRGNLLLLEKRCTWRGIGFEETGLAAGETFGPGDYDLLYIGGGQDRDQEAIAEDLLDSKGKAILEFAESGKPLLAVCGGFQLLGREWSSGKALRPGLGVFDAVTHRGDPTRLIGAVAIEAEYAGATLTIAGFENHAGRTELGAGSKPFGRVLSGHGNNGRDGTEGARTQNAIGTYLHGPLLPKNYLLADLLIAAALDPESPGRVRLDELDDGTEELAHQQALAAAINYR